MCMSAIYNGPSILPNTMSLRIIRSDVETGYNVSKRTCRALSHSPKPHIIYRNLVLSFSITSAYPLLHFTAISKIYEATTPLSPDSMRRIRLEPTSAYLPATDLCSYPGAHSDPKCGEQGYWLDNPYLILKITAMDI